MKAISEIRDYLAHIEYALDDIEDDVGDVLGTNEADVDSDRELEIERLRRENLGLRDTIRKQAEHIAKLERQQEQAGRIAKIDRERSLL